jgi:anti-sigma factor RsiW
MKHLSEEQLDGYALGTLPDLENAVIEAHLEGCVDCSTRLEMLKQLPEALSEIDPVIAAPVVPFPRKRPQFQTTWMRVAAALVFGFAAGLMAARQTCGPAVLVMDDFSVSQRTQTVAMTPVTCAVVDLGGW